MPKIKGLHAFLIKEQIRDVFHKNEYFFEEERKPYLLNIVGIRSDFAQAQYNDVILVIYRNPKLDWEVLSCVATTEPGQEFYTGIPDLEGISVLMPNQYIDAYEIGHHDLSDYQCLKRAPREVQVFHEPFDQTVLSEFKSAEILRGNYPVNLHCSTVAVETEVVDSYVAGSQIFRNKTDFNEFMKLCTKHAKRHKDLFTYTLLTEGDLNP